MYKSLSNAERGVALFLGLMSVFAASAIGQPTLEDLPLLDLPEPANADRALNAIGNRLPLWAEVYDMSVPQFARTLREDPYSFLDRSGRLFFTEPDADQIPSANEDMYSPLAYPLSQTFLLESRPQAPVTIYLDFDGHIIENTAWNQTSTTDGSAIIAQPWSRDGDRSNFSESELRDIQTIWRWVAEDFAPFEVNVTTRFPGEDALARTGPDDLFFGTRVLFTPNTFYNCSCGGVAYVGVLDSTNSAFYQPALVFNGGVSAAAEAASHEVGHNGGLSHDGTSTQAYYGGHGSGATGWAPIMGVGYSKQLVQWSRGEYAEANQTQDDYQVFASNLLPFAADDHGDTPQAATAASVSGDGVTSSIEVRGVIGNPDDIDVVQVAAGTGDFSVQVSPVAVAANLDIGLQLFDNTGQLIAESNPLEDLNADMTLALPAGQYFLAVTGVGKGDPLATGYSDYGSLGGYVLTAQFPDGGAVTPPSAAFAMPGYTPDFAPLTVTFDASASVDVATYQWDFGDGNGLTTTDAVVSHQYQQPGTFEATLVVTDADLLTATASRWIDVINQAPVALGSVDQSAVEVGQRITVADAGSYDTDALGTIEDYQWNFGDGATAMGITASHSYQQPGTYAVVLTVTDDLGATASTRVGSVDVTLPAIVESTAVSGTSIAGSSSGDHTTTHGEDGVSLVVTERMSGGRKSTRYSYAAYDLQFTVPAGRSVIRAVGAQSDSSDGDVFELSWQFADQRGSIGALTINTSVLTSAPFEHSAGTLTVSLVDSARAPGGTSLDSAFLDALLVTTDTTVAPDGDGNGDGSGDDGGTGDTGLSLQLVETYKVKGQNNVRLSWAPADQAVEVLRDGISLGSYTGGVMTDENLGKGGMTLQYQACTAVMCSSILTVAF